MIILIPRADTGYGLLDVVVRTEGSWLLHNNSYYIMQLSLYDIRYAIYCT